MKYLYLYGSLAIIARDNLGPDCRGDHGRNLDDFCPYRDMALGEGSKPWTFLSVDVLPNRT